MLMGFGASSAQADALVRGRVSAFGEYDTNARRVAVDKDQPDGFAPGDGLARLQLDGSVALSRPGFTLLNDAAVGLKLFINQRTERMVVGQNTTDLLVGLPFGFWARALSIAKIRAQNTNTRAYFLEQARLTVGRNLGWGFAVRGGVTANAFYSFWTPEFSSLSGGGLLAVRFFLTRKEFFELSGTAATRGFFSLLRATPPQAAADSRIRADWPLAATISFSSSRRLFVNTGYTLLRNASNSRGDSYTRHRLYALAGTVLPLAITVTGQAALQITQYDDGLSIGQRLFLADDDESQNSVQAAISRYWAYGFSTEARFAWYGNELARGRLSFSRITSAVGIRYDL